MIILTDLLGNILHWQRAPYRTPGEYTTPCLRIIEIDAAANVEPVEVADLGPASSKDFATHAGTVTCERYHASATVTLQEVDECQL